ncbi:MAG: RNA polymerase sigma factor [Planctomycetes bacterium]|nr:RNA polymerase sigma factor [Planctomycetota bacterium]
MGRTQGAVFGYAARMLGDRDLADDATQEAFIAAYHAITTFQGSNFRAWVLRIAHNKALDLLRARRRRAATSLDQDDAPELADPSPISPDGWLDRATLNELLQRALAGLSPEQRAAVVLRDVQGLSYAEIAQVLSVDLGTVKSRIARARGRLREFLVEHRELLPSDIRLPS